MPVTEHPGTALDPMSLTPAVPATAETGLVPTTEPPESVLVCSTFSTRSTLLALSPSLSTLSLSTFTFISTLLTVSTLLLESVELLTQILLYLLQLSQQVAKFDSIPLIFNNIFPLSS